jgi:hypothetical protein
MSSLQSGLPWARVRPTTWFLLAVPAAALFFLSCSTAPRVPRSSPFVSLPVRFQPQPSWGGPLADGRSQLNQSCGAACAAPVNPSTGEILAPAATRLAPVAEKVVQAIEAAQGFLTIQRLLTEAELEQVQAVVEQCVAQAHADVNEAFQKQDGGFKFKNGKFPNDAECDRRVGVDERGRPVSLAQELGTLKHAAAFACINDRLPENLRGNFSVEPRYKGDPEVNGTVLTNNKLDSLKPDLVVHATRNATNIQCVFEFKFPCYERHRLDPMNSPGVKDQLKGYGNLSKSCRVTLVTPAGLKPYEGN